MEKVGFLDIEMSPDCAWVYGQGEHYVSYEDIHIESQIISFCWKWKDSKKIIFADQSKNRRVKQDRKLLKKLWDLLDEADVIVGHNADGFDIKKIKAHLQLAGFPPPSPFRVIDTLKLARPFGYTSRSLKYLTHKLNKKFKKMEHSRFPGKRLGIACYLGVKEAWKENKQYNIFDVLSCEELFYTFLPWSPKVVLHPKKYDKKICSCGSTEFKENGHAYTSTGKFQRMKCKVCGKTHQLKENLLTQKQKQNLLKG